MHKLNKLSLQGSSLWTPWAFLKVENIQLCAQSCTSLPLFSPEAANQWEGKHSDCVFVFIVGKFFYEKSNFFFTRHFFLIFSGRIKVLSDHSARAVRVVRRLKNAKWNTTFRFKVQRIMCLSFLSYRIRTATQCKVFDFKRPYVITNNEMLET